MHRARTDWVYGDPVRHHGRGIWKGLPISFSFKGLMHKAASL